jgi:hypothetical protein
MLVDPTAGVGYAFGEVLPSSDMTTIAANMPKAVDGSAGGTYTPGTAITINGSGIVTSSLTCSGTTKLKLASRTLTRIQPIFPDLFSGGGVATCTRAVNFAFRDTKAASPGTIWLMPLTKLINGATLTKIDMSIDPANGRAGNLGTCPKFEIFTQTTAGVTASLGTSTDATAGVIPAYEAIHNLTKSGLASVIDTTTYAYWLVVTGESGANYTQNLLYLGVLATMTVTEYSEG